MKKLLDWIKVQHYKWVLGKCRHLCWNCEYIKECRKCKDILKE